MYIAEPKIKLLLDDAVLQKECIEYVALQGLSFSFSFQGEGMHICSYVHINRSSPQNRCCLSFVLQSGSRVDCEGSLY